MRQRCAADNLLSFLSFSLGADKFGTYICRYRITAITSVFHTDDVGSTPTTCSTKALTATITRIVKRIRHFPPKETTWVRFPFRKQVP